MFNLLLLDKDSFSAKYNENDLQLDKLTAKKTTKLIPKDFDNFKNKKISPRKIINPSPPMQSKNKKYYKNSKSILKKENEKSDIRSNEDAILRNGSAFNQNHSKNYDFINLKNQKNRKSNHISDFDKREFYLRNANYASSSNMRSKLPFKFFIKFIAKYFLCK